MLLYRCSCGKEVHYTPQKHYKHPQFAEITNDLANQVQISVIRRKYNLSVNQAAGLFARHWERVRKLSK